MPESTRSPAAAANPVALRSGSASTPGRERSCLRRRWRGSAPSLSCRLRPSYCIPRPSRAACPVEGARRPWRASYSPSPELSTYQVRKYRTLVRSDVNRYAIVRRISFIWPAAAGDVSHTVCSPLSRHQARVSGPHGEAGTAPAADAARLKADPLWRACPEEAAPPTPAPRSRWLSGGIDADHRRNS
jgi:hypothetical protein